MIGAQDTIDIIDDVQLNVFVFYYFYVKIFHRFVFQEFRVFFNVNI